jgi:hypothetical protein
LYCLAKTTAGNMAKLIGGAGGESVRGVKIESNETSARFGPGSSRREFLLTGLRQAG